MSSTGTATTTNKSVGSILVQIWNTGVKDFETAEAWIETNVERVEAVLPGAAPIVADLKQAASDAMGAVAAGSVTYEPALVTGMETLADAAIDTEAGPYAQPLNKLANDAILAVVAKGTAALQAWALKKQAAWAENAAPTSPVPAGPVSTQ